MTETRETYATRLSDLEAGASHPGDGRLVPRQQRIQRQYADANECCAEWTCPSCQHVACCPLCPKRGKRVGPSEHKQYGGEGVA
jgi:hypothetical protein